MKPVFLLCCLLGMGFLTQARPPDPLAKPRREFVYGSPTVSKTTFSHDGRLVIVSTNRSRIGVFQGRTALLVNEFRGHQHSITALATWPDRDTVVSADAAGLLLSWRPRSGQVVGQVRMPGPVQVVCPQPGGILLATLVNGGVWLVDAGTGKKQMLPASDLKKAPTTLQFDATGEYLAIGFADGSVAVRTMKTGQTTLSKLFSTPIRDMAFRDDSLLAVAGTPALSCWLFRSESPARNVPVSRPVWCLAQQLNSPDHALFLGLVSGDIVRYTLANQQEQAIGRTKTLVQDLFINPRERLLLASYRKASPKTWLLR